MLSRSDAVSIGDPIMIEAARTAVEETAAHRNLGRCRGGTKVGEMEVAALIASGIASGATSVTRDNDFDSFSRIQALWGEILPATETPVPHQDHNPAGRGQMTSKFVQKQTAKDDIMLEDTKMSSCMEHVSQLPHDIAQRQSCASASSETVGDKEAAMRFFLLNAIADMPL